MCLRVCTFTGAFFEGCRGHQLGFCSPEFKVLTGRLGAWALRKKEEQPLAKVQVTPTRNVHVSNVHVQVLSSPLPLIPLIVPPCPH